MFTLHSSYCPQRRFSQKENGYARLRSCRIQLFGEFGKDIHHTFEANHFIQENIFDNAHIRPVPIAMNTNSAFTGSFSGSPFWYQQFDLRQKIILREGQPFVDFDTADNCRLYVTTTKATNFEDYILSIPIDDFNDHYVLVFDLTSMQDATENCHYPEIVGEPVILELNFTQPLENVTKLIVLGRRMSSVAVDKFGVVA